VRLTFPNVAGVRGKGAGNIMYFVSGQSSPICLFVCFSNYSPSVAMELNVREEIACK